MDDDILMKQISVGDAKAFGALVRRHQTRIVRFAERMVGDSDAAQDLAQETFLRLWRARTTCAAQGDLAPYLLRIARNLCLDHFRSRRETAALDETNEPCRDPGAEPLAAAQAGALADLVRRSVQGLPEAQRVVFILSHYEGMSYAEIAQIVGCPLGTVASRKYQATETLRRRLGPWVEGDESR